MRVIENERPTSLRGPAPDSLFGAPLCLPAPRPYPECRDDRPSEPGSTR